MQPLVCCLGDLVEDVAVRLLEPLRLGTDTSARIERHRGGSAANVAAMVAGQGVASRFVGRVGADALGDRLVELLTDLGVEVLAQRDGRTGTIVVLVGADGERSFLTDRAAAAELRDVDVDAVLDGVAWLHVPWYSFCEGAIAAEARVLTAAAGARGIPLSIDTSSVALLDRAGASMLREVVASTRPAAVLANEHEAAALGIGVDGVPGALVTIVKQGPAPALVMRPGQRPIEVPVTPGEPVVDTTGAGDAFAAAFIVATLDGADLEQAARAGHRLARRVIARPGADTWAPEPEAPAAPHPGDPSGGGAT